MTAHLPALRLGKSYASLDKTQVLDHRSGALLIEVSQVNAGIVRRASLKEMSYDDFEQVLDVHLR